MKHKYGFTTGSCAAAAAKGAAYGLLQGAIPEYVEINTPAGIPLGLRPIYRRIGQGFSECAIRKYSGDDPDVTNGCKIHVRIDRTEAANPNDSLPTKQEELTRSQEGIRFMGGEGVGMVTKPGLQIPQGEPAINPVPRLMIRSAIKEIMGDYKGLNVTITVPGGRKLAKKTFNERLGIIGGISIIGTTGIVKPMSLDSFKTSLVCGLDVARASGHETIVLVPGSIGEKGVLKHFAVVPLGGVSKYQVIQMSNFVGFMLKEALKHGFKQIMLAGHPGKLAKLIRGDFYTHSSRSKPANDILINIFKKEKMGHQLIDKLNTSLTVEGMVDIIREHHKLYIFNRIADEIQSSASDFISARIKIGSILFDMKKNIIGISKGFKEWQRNSQIK
jgi:cobalt-precorrin-5B (C1)-methyltransferase